MTISDGTLRMFVAGYPWWKAHNDFSDEDQLEIHFGGLSDGSVGVTLASGDPNDFEQLENFEVQALEAIDWAQPSIHQIYCSEPLKDVFALHAVVHDYLIDVGSFKLPHDFLNFNFDRKLSGFASIARTDSFLVARAPESLCAIICEELERQGVPHHLLTSTLPQEKRIWVSIGDCNFLCDTATAIFDE